MALGRIFVFAQNRMHLGYYGFLGSKNRGFSFYEIESLKGIMMLVIRLSGSSLTSKIITNSI